MSDNRPLLSMVTPIEMGNLLAARVRELRLLNSWTRSTLAQRAGVSAASLKRFETTGKIALDSLLKIAHALARLDDFALLLKPPEARSMADLERRSALVTRKRGRR